MKDACEIASIYINHYKIFEHLRGKTYIKSTDKKLIEAIYSDKDTFNVTNNFANAMVYWDGAWELGFVALKREKFPKARQEELFARLRGIQNKQTETKGEQWV